LKPANIIVSPSGRASLLDFGGCQVVIDGVPVLEGARTHGYCPPECEGAGPARLLIPCADVYGLGSTLYHMLTGIDPRDRQGRRHGKAGEPLDAADLPVRVSPALRRVVARCLAVRPSDRFADARQVALALWGAS
jgi:serine/threonine-protein kinase